MTDTKTSDPDKDGGRGDGSHNTRTSGLQWARKRPRTKMYLTSVYIDAQCVARARP